VLFSSKPALTPLHPRKHPSVDQGRQSKPAFGRLPLGWVGQSKHLLGPLLARRSSRNHSAKHHQRPLGSRQPCLLPPNPSRIVPPSAVQGQQQPSTSIQTAAQVPSLLTIPPRLILSRSWRWRGSTATPVCARLKLAQRTAEVVAGVAVEGEVEQATAAQAGSPQPLSFHHQTSSTNQAS